MKEKVRCKACGYIMDKDDLGEFCPACGVKKEMFEPWKDQVGHLRRLILEQDIHPVIVHAPEALTFLLLAMSASFPLFPSDLQSAYLWPALVVMTWLLPFTVLAAYLSGLSDAMVRFRKVATPVLLKKQLLGGLFALATIGMIVVVSCGNFSALGRWLAYLACVGVAMACGALLGKIGSKLISAVMPGDKIFMKKKKPAKAPAAQKAE